MLRLLFFWPALAPISSQLKLCSGVTMSHIQSFLLIFYVIPSNFISDLIVDYPFFFNLKTFFFFLRIILKHNAHLFKLLN